MITARDLSVQGDQHQLILNQVSANFPPGQIHVIMGPNGSGKSTLLRCLCSLQPIKEGSIELAGRQASSFGIKELATLLSWTEAEHSRGPPPTA
jgi:iron complex transport system ATP-binding protein